MKNQRDLATGWFRKADSDLTTAQLVLNSDGPYDTACYHAQQAAEKSLKGFLAFRGIAIPRIHDLLELNQLCADAAEFWPVEVDSLARLWRLLKTFKIGQLMISNLRKTYVLLNETTEISDIRSDYLYFQNRTMYGLSHILDRSHGMKLHPPAILTSWLSLSLPSPLILIWMNRV